jgi:hypothetical protein
MNQCGTSLACSCLLLVAVAIAQEPKAAAKLNRVECHGQLRDGIVAIGGETTGTTLRFQKVTWELQFKDGEGKAFAQSHNKQPVSITGTLRRVAGVERKERWIVDVERFAKRDPDQIKEGASITLTAKLARDPKENGQWLIDSGDVICPAKLPAEISPLPTQRVTLRGSVEAFEPAVPAQPFFIRIIKLETPEN